VGREGEGEMSSGPAQLDIGDNRFMVQFNSEGGWKHAMRNGLG
jgi:hypothetical protein